MTLFWICSILFSTALISGLLIYVFKPSSQQTLKMILSFSGAFLFSISILNILPEIYGHEGGTDHGNEMNYGIYIIIGFVIQLFLDYLSKGIEHGHDHIHMHDNKISWLGLLVGICLHSFLEGMPFIDAMSYDTRHAMLAGIVIHNIPIALILMGLFIHSGMSKINSILLLILFASMSPLGALVSNYSNSLINLHIEEYLKIVMALVVGIFLHVSTSILFESGENHQMKKTKLFSVLIGIACAVAISRFHAH